MKLFSMNKPYVSRLVNTCILFTKNVKNLKPDSKTSVPPIMKNSRNVSSSIKYSTNQDRITFKP